MNINELAIYGAKAKLKALEDMAEELRTFIKSGKKKYKTKAKRKMSAAARKAISIRMKKIYAAKKNGTYSK